MRTKKAKPNSTTPGPAAQQSPESEKRTLEPHEIVGSTTVQAAVGMQSWGKFAGEPELGPLLNDLRERVKKVQGGDMRSVEAMLYGQAMTLETIFTNLARRATSQEYLKQFQTYLGLALKAQAQCRATLEALAEIKNPRPVAFVKQANISSGHQQVNNGLAPQTGDPHARAFTGAGARAEDSQSAPNELLEQQHGNWLDTRAQGEAGGADPHLAPLGEVNRAAHG